MMNQSNIEELLQPEVQKYIEEQKNTDLHQLLLKKSPFQKVSIQQICQQIQGRKILEKKVPRIIKKGIIFPPHLNLEQTSSQSTAAYKASLVGGKTFIDLTSGFGIDAFFISEKFAQSTLIERNAELVELVKHNWNILGKNADFINQDLEQYLEQANTQFDLIYLDPARRDAEKKKVFLLEDLSPNILEIQSLLREKADTVLLKLSPLIDLKYLISEIKNLAEIHIVGIRNEVKEILLKMTKQPVLEDIKVFCVNLETQEPIIQFNFNAIENEKADYSDVLTYLYIPNNMLLKSGAFQWISSCFRIKKLHPNTHFYTSANLIEDFPGRVLKVEKIDAKQIEKGGKYNIVSKNHPLQPEEIKKKYKLKDGGSQYLIFTQSILGKIILKSIEN